MKVCCECHVAVLRPHPELIWWVKCPVCGYSELNIDNLQEINKELARQNPMMRIDGKQTKDED